MIHTLLVLFVSMISTQILTIVHQFKCNVDSIICEVITIICDISIIKYDVISAIQYQIYIYIYW